MALRQQRTVNNRGQLQPPNVRTVGDIPWTLLSTAGFTVLIQIIGDPARLFLQSTPAFFSESLGQDATGASLAGNLLTVTFTGGPSPGSAISLPSAVQGVRGSLGAYLAGGRQLLPLGPPFIPPVTSQDWTAGTPLANTVSVFSTDLDFNNIVLGATTFLLGGIPMPVDQIVFSPARIDLVTSSVVTPGDAFEVVSMDLRLGVAGLNVLLAKGVIL